MIEIREGIHGVVDILLGFEPKDAGSIPAGSVIFPGCAKCAPSNCHASRIYTVWCSPTRIGGKSAPASGASSAEARIRTRYSPGGRSPTSREEASLVTPLFAVGVSNRTQERPPSFEYSTLSVTVPDPVYARSQATVRSSSTGSAQV